MSLRRLPDTTFPARYALDVEAQPDQVYLRWRDLDAERGRRVDVGDFGLVVERSRLLAAICDPGPGDFFNLLKPTAPLPPPDASTAAHVLLARSEIETLLALVRANQVVLGHFGYQVSPYSAHLAERLEKALRPRREEPTERSTASGPTIEAEVHPE